MENYLGEIRMFAGDYAPRDWLICDGSLIEISGNEMLFNLLGTFYGGDGWTNFALPDLRGRVPIHIGGTPAIVLGEAKGAENADIKDVNLPPHTHQLNAVSDDATAADPKGNMLATGKTNLYVSLTATPAAKLVAMNRASVISANGKSVSIMQPYVAVNFIIAITGVYPSPQ